MTASVLWIVILTAAGALPTAVVYLRREPAVRGRRLLLGLRIASIFLLATLLVNPTLPGTAEEPAAAGGFWVLLDWNRALEVPDAQGRPLRDTVVARARGEAREGARLALLGEEPEGVDTLTLAGAPWRPPGGDVRRSLVRLAEAGADSILFLSPLRMTPGELERNLEGVPVPVRVERVGAPVRNVGILELDLPRRTSLGEEIQGQLVVFGEETDPASDSVVVVVEADEEAVERLHFPTPPPGAATRIDIVLPAPTDTGSVRYGARVQLEGDRFTRDDSRVRRVRVGPPEGGILLVSMVPDWEPRVLLPTLEAATGLEGEGYLRLDQDRWLPLTVGGEPMTTVSREHFAPRLSRAGLLVIHGVADEAPEWLRRAGEDHPRVIHLPSGSAGSALASISPAGPRPGEWVPTPDPPASPVAPYLAGLGLGGLPPLGSLLAPGPDGGTPVLLVRSDPGAEPRPALVLREGPRGRRAVALADGFWRWAHREGLPREVYRGVWSGVAGWLLAPDVYAAGAGVRLLEQVISEHEAPSWHVPGSGDTVLQLRFWPESVDPEDAAEGRVRTSRVALDAAGRGTSDALPPGRWRWSGEVEDAPDDPEGVRGEGELEVETWSGALAVPPLQAFPERWAPDPQTAPLAQERTGGRPVRAHPAPYLLVLLLLCAEWIGRRRQGLR